MSDKQTPAPGLQITGNVERVLNHTPGWTAYYVRLENVSSGTLKTCGVSLVTACPELPDQPNVPPPLLRKTSPAGRAAVSLEPGDSELFEVFLVGPDKFYVRSPRTHMLGFAAKQTLKLQLVTDTVPAGECEVVLDRSDLRQVFLTGKINERSLAAM